MSDICKPLLELPGAAERLRLFEADLLREGSFDAAMAGCAAAIHTATPAMLSAPKGKAREMIIDPAIKGLQNVLNAVNRTPTGKIADPVASFAAFRASVLARIALHLPDASRRPAWPQ